MCIPLQRPISPTPEPKVMVKMEAEAESSASSPKASDDEGQDGGYLFH